MMYIYVGNSDYDIIEEIYKKEGSPMPDYIIKSPCVVVEDSPKELE